MPELPPYAAPLRDTDKDGIPDKIERLAGTDPEDADTDRDGVPDGMEDRNRDGIVDPGETDPRTYGMFPARSPTSSRRAVIHYWH